MKISTLISKFTLKASACAAAAVFAFFPVKASAVETVSLPVTGTYEQTSARQMINKINAFRTSGTAWYWNEGNTMQVQCGTLPALTYDYNLEQAAMLRAMEISVYYDHARPNGTRCFTAYSHYAAAENIAAGFTTADSVFEAWKEEDEYYSGQGHRRNMLSDSVTAVGIGHVIRGGKHFWVQEFRSPTGSTTVTTVTNGSKTLMIDVEKSKLTASLGFKETNTSRGIYPGDTLDLSDLAEMVYYGEASYWNLPIPMPLNSAVTVSSDSPATISGNTLTATGGGTITLSAVSSYTGQTITCSIKVNRYNLYYADCSMDFYNEYTGEPIEPKPVITYNSKTLVENVDYTMSYSDNIDAGYAYYKVTGVGNYTGTITGVFYISPKAITKSMVKLDKERYEYNGSAVEPVVTVTCNGKTLTDGTDYTIAYGNNNRAGTGYVYVTGHGNYGGSVSVSFTITKKGMKSDDSDADDSEEGTSKTEKNEIVTSKLKTPSLSKPKQGKKSFTASWKKVSSVSGYQLQYSTDKKFKKYTLNTYKGNKKTKTTIKKLKSKKTYYVRVRSYKISKGKTTYSKWSGVKKVKTK